MFAQTGVSDGLKLLLFSFFVFDIAHFIALLYKKYISQQVFISMFSYEKVTVELKYASTRKVKVKLKCVSIRKVNVELKYAAKR